ncbi:protoporphyrinogen/coproporphyrinogen oxidase [Streptomyces sp. NPDC057307]|uniref:protoporphyrinogen/coproporphyrinogen oxidase n=1 Tax=Streptomyces sp. NPDC057307 TaxID=3346096 RepID=UPI00363DDB99
MAETSAQPGRQPGTQVDVAVVGGGIAGLTAAYRLKEAGRAPEVFEADSDIGGRMRARKEDGWLIETGTETLASHGYPATWRLIKDVGLDRDGGVLKVGSLAGVWRGGKAHAGSGHWVGTLTGAGLSPGGRLAMTGMLGALLPALGKVSTRRPGESPLGLRTVAEFVDGRHPDLHDYLLQPAAATGWAWDTRRSCVAPLVATMVATRGLHGWRTYRDGMDSLARKVAERLTVHTGRAVQEVQEITGSPEGGVRLVFADGSVVTAREAVLAVPAPVARKLYPSAPADELPFLDATSYSRMIRVTCLVDRPLTVRQSRGTKKVYALLIPEKEDGYLAGLTFEHFKAANRAPRGQGLVSMLTAARATDELMDRPDEEVVEALLGRATRYVPELRTALRRSYVHRFPYAAPEATPDALRLQGAFLDRPARAVEFAGDWVFQRPTSEAAVQAGELAAERILSRRRSPAVAEGPVRTA